MPFKSKSQMRTCYNKHDSRWNCDSWMNETPSVCCLPNKKGDKVKTRCMRNGERIVSPVKIGPRGGKYFSIEEKDSRGSICTTKVYLSKSVKRQTSTKKKVQREK